jgi:ferritin-like metal-binding protein YciE
MTAETRSPDEIERDLEQTRVEIGETLEDIQRQLSPGQLLDQTLRYFGGPHRLGQSLGELIVRNPLPITLIGVGFAWLAFSGSSSRRAESYDRMSTEPSAGWPLTPVERNALMAVSRENLADWLRDARTMEDLAIETLEKQARRLDRYPELQARLREHLTETRRQAERLDECMQRLGVAALATGPRADKLPGEEQIAALLGGGPVIQNGITDYAFEHFEIATYRTLIEAASEAGEAEAERVCRENLREEEAMAEWLARRIPDVTRQYLYDQAAQRIGAEGAAISQAEGDAIR